MPWPAPYLARWRAARWGGARFRQGCVALKILEITNTDFALRQFLLPLMRALRARGHEAVGVAPDGPLAERVRAEGFRVLAVPMARSHAPGPHWRTLRLLRAAIRAERPDLVHGHMPISGFLGRVAARLEGVPRVAYTCHGLLFAQPKPLVSRLAAFAMEFLGARTGGVFMTVSQRDAALARRLGISRRAVAIGNGRDPAIFRPDAVARARVRAELGVARDRVVVVIVSRLVRAKGFAELLAAMRAVDGELWVVGERLPSDHGEDIEPRFAASGLDAKLRRLGYREDIPALLAAADIFALPSYNEGLPMSVVEAMLCGLPVVASDIAGPREQVVPEVTGLLVPPRAVEPLAAALRRLTDDPALRARMGVCARARAVQCYDEAVVIERTMRLLEA